MAKFSRASTAYADDGSVVAANVPRMSSKGLLIEEGTTNLLTNPTLSNNGSGWTITNYNNRTPYTFTTVNGYNKICFTHDDTATGTDTSLGIKQSVNVTAGKSYNYSVYIEGTKEFLDNVVSQVSGVQTYLEIQWFQNTSYQNKAKASSSNLQRISDTLLFVNFSSTAPSNCTIAQIWCIIDDPNLVSGQYCNIYKPQLEQKSYATSYTSGTRAAESFVIPAAALNTTQSTIEFDVYSNATVPVINTIFDTRVGTQTSLNYAIILQRSAAGVWNLFAGYGTGFETKSYTDSALTAKTKKHIAIRFGSDGKVALFLDRIKVATTDNTYSLTLGNIITFLSDYRSLQQLDGYISNLRISNIARTDAELTNTGALAVDEFTTYFLPLTDNLGAQGQGVSVSSGNGATKQLRTGAGYRSVTAKAAVKSYILRTAKFYPQIIASADGKTTQSRVGSGYRTPVVQSSADVKLIEPGIEISTAVIERKGVTSVIERLSRTEVIGVPYIGDTVTLKAEFYTKGGVLADPVNISLKFFDSLKNQIGTTITIGSQHRISAGVYEYDYTVPSGYRNIFYEFAATQESTPQLIPGRIACKQRVDVGNWE